MHFGTCSAYRRRKTEEEGKNGNTIMRNILRPGLGSESGCDDRTERARCGVLIRGSGLAADRVAELGDAVASVQFPLSRVETRGYRGRRRVHSKGVENVAEFAQDFRAEREYRAGGGVLDGSFSVNPSFSPIFRH